MIKFSDFLTEAKLNAKELNKYGGYRAEKFKEMIINGEDFETDIGKVKVQNSTENINTLNSILNGTLKASAKLKLTDDTELALNKFIKTSEFGGQGAKKLSGADWEKVIVVAHNVKSQGISVDEAVKLGDVDGWSDKYESVLETGFKIVESVKSNVPMKHYGASSASLTSQWNQYFIDITGSSAKSATKTPKTDMYLTDGTHISLKKEGGSQLMSGGQPEALATLQFAYENTPESVKDSTFKKSFENLSNNVINDFGKFKDVSISQIKKDIKAGKSSELIDAVKTQLDKNEEMRKALRKLTDTQEFKMEIVREAMTGNNKFNEDLPKSTHMMVFNEAGVGSFKEINDSIVSKYTSVTKFDISFKAASGRAWTAMKGIVSESLDDLLETTLSESLDEMLLTEGKFLNKIKKGVSDFTTFIKTLVMNWMNKIFNILKTNLSQFVGLLGLDIKVSEPFINYSV